MEFFAGIILAIVVGVSTSSAGMDRDRSFYPVVTIIVASYYVLFALMGGSLEALFIESIVMAAFLVAAIAGFKNSPWIIVVALATHGILDVFHSHMIANPGVPAWWPGFCMAYDVVAAGYLAFRLSAGMKKSRGGINLRI